MSITPPVSKSNWAPRFKNCRTERLLLEVWLLVVLDASEPEPEAEPEPRLAGFFRLSTDSRELGELILAVVAAAKLPSSPFRERLALFRACFDLRATAFMKPLILPLAVEDLLSSLSESSLSESLSEEELDHASPESTSMGPELPPPEPEETVEGMDRELRAGLGLRDLKLDPLLVRRLIGLMGMPAFSSPPWDAANQAAAKFCCALAICTKRLKLSSSLFRRFSSRTLSSSLSEESYESLPELPPRCFFLPKILRALCTGLGNGDGISMRREPYCGTFNGGAGVAGTGVELA